MVSHPPNYVIFNDSCIKQGRVVKAELMLSMLYKVKGGETKRANLALRMELTHVTGKLVSWLGDWKGWSHGRNWSNDLCASTQLKPPYTNRSEWVSWSFPEPRKDFWIWFPCWSKHQGTLLLPCSRLGFCLTPYRRSWAGQISVITAIGISSIPFAATDKV